MAVAATMKFEELYSRRGLLWIKYITATIKGLRFQFEFGKFELRNMSYVKVKVIIIRD